MPKLSSIAFALAASLMGLSLESAMAEETRNESTASLKGTFRFTAVKTCTDSVLGSTLYFYFNGTLVYDGHGAAHLAQRGTLVLPGLPPTSFEETAELTYTVRPNGSVSQEGSLRAVDQSYTLTGARMVGHLDPHGSVLIFNAPIPPDKETVRGPGGGVSEYLCGASGTAVRIH